jgi:hypothetical protein
MATMRNWMVGLAGALAISGALVGSSMAAPSIRRDAAGTNGNALSQQVHWEQRCYVQHVNRWTAYGWRAVPVERCQRVWVPGPYGYAPGYAPYGYRPYGY